MEVPPRGSPAGKNRVCGTALATGKTG